MRIITLTAFLLLGATACATPETTTPETTTPETALKSETSGQVVRCDRFGVMAGGLIVYGLQRESNCVRDGFTQAY